ncbi:MAG: hypothetical protein AAGJ10_19160 [Bacteroidota bacterium]
MSRWRLVGWGSAAVLLLLPLIAMQFTDEVHWDLADFIIAGVLMGSVGLLYEIVVRKTGNGAYRAGVGVALVGAFLLVWVNGAVGLIGSENNSANLMYAGVLGIGFIGAVIARFKAQGMAYALYAAALAVGLVAAIALIGDLGAPYNGPFEIIIPNAFFATLFAGAGRLFQVAARG